MNAMILPAEQVNIASGDKIKRVNALTESQRSSALDAARRRIAGREPEPDGFAHLADGKYPDWILNSIRGLSVVMLVAAFLPSAMRLHEQGLSAFGFSITDDASKYAAAISIVLMAEIGQLVFSLATIAAGDRLQRLALTFGAAVCTLIALSGNATANEQHALDSLFAFLDTFAPPVLVLITAQVLKAQMLHAVSERHHARVQYARAHQAWQTAYDTAHEHARWMHASANELRDALRSANKVSKAVLRELSDEDWRALILRELSAENWYERVEQRIEVRAQQHSARASGGAHTGELAGTVTMQDGVHVGTCPHCGKTFKKETQESAMKALVAHVGRFCEVKNGVEK